MWDLKNYDLVTPDGSITYLKRLSDNSAETTVFIQNIPINFKGFHIPKDRVFFNIKSTMAQLGIDGIKEEFELDYQHRCAQVKVLLNAYGKVGTELLKLLKPGASIGKLFAADERRRVRDPIYLSRMFGRFDRWGRPLLSLGGRYDTRDLMLEKVEGRTIAHLALLNGHLVYDEDIYGFLVTLSKALINENPIRDYLKLHQVWKPNLPTKLNKDEMLLVRTLPLHVRTVFGHVASELLPEGYHHTSASILQPDTAASGDIYEFYGESHHQITTVPLEFYTLEPYREYVHFSDRDQLQSCLENSEVFFKAFATAPNPFEYRAAVYIVKGSQMLNLEPSDWIIRQPRIHEFPGLAHRERQAELIERYIEQQPCYPYLKNIEDDVITSQGILLTRYFPSPLMKRMLLSDQVQRLLKGIYFQEASRSYDGFFSAEDRALLHDLYKFAIPTFWVDNRTNQILQYIEKPDRDTGLFVPIDKISIFLQSTVFGVYGSNLLQGVFEEEMKNLMRGLLEMRKEMTHPLLNKNTPLALVTGGGPGLMEVGNRIAKELDILSCANIVDFRQRDKVINEQHQNPYIEAKMTYRLDKLVERQAEFNLDFPIFLTGGIGTDFELSLEEVRRKVGAVSATPILLMGETEYWKEKITHRYQMNLKTHTIEGSEWLSNCFYCVHSAAGALKVYRQYFQGTLPIGKGGPIYADGFVSVD